MIKLGPETELVLKKKYLRKGENTWEDLVVRVCEALGANNSEVQDFKEMVGDQFFIPNSPTLMNAGTEKGQLSGCFVLPVGDSMDEIMDAVKWMALVHKSGGGTGFSFSDLRESGTPVSSREGVASGPLSFMRIFDVTTEEVKQGGARRGANMACMEIDHPDIEFFIKAKNNLDEYNNFNFSVMIPDSFMKAVQCNIGWDLISRYDEKVVRTIDARIIWDKIIQSAWKTGEPGVLFYDTINKMNTLKKVGLIKSTNPCGEQPLFSFESCNLGSINLVKFVNDKGEFMEDMFADFVGLCVTFLNRVIDNNYFPLPQIADMTTKTRKIGLGVMGLADMLILMKIKYGSEECIDFLDKLFTKLSLEAWNASTELGNKEGVFPLADSFKPCIGTQSVANPRNSTVTTIAPTGTISIIAGVSSGIEPLFKKEYVREDSLGTRKVTHPLFDRIDYDEYKEFIVTAHEVSADEHLAVQTVIQKHIDNAVSKTVNMRGDAPIEEVESLYWKAWESGCKGLTVFRHGSRDGVMK